MVPPESAPTVAAPRQLPLPPEAGIRAAPPPEASPFIKWAGGKRRLVPELMRRAPDRYGAFHEPFCGGGALFFGIAAEREARGLDPAEPWANLSDTNQRLVRTYRAVQSDVEGLIARLREYAAAHTRDHYYAVRALDVDAMEHDADVAAWFIYLNKTGFNGLYRVNRKGGFNVPIGSYKNPNVCDDQNLRAASRVLQGATVRHETFDAVLERAQAQDLVYFDPPYVPASATASFTAYTKGGFDLSDQERLRDLARDLKAKGVSVLLSNSDTPPVRSLYRRGFVARQVMMTRAINSKASRRGAVPELIIS